MKTPTEIFLDWLDGHDKETRVAVAVDGLITIPVKANPKAVKLVSPFTP